MIAHNSDIRLYSSGWSTWLATARYRNVKIPVEAIPIERIFAPDAKLSSSGAGSGGSCRGAGAATASAIRAEPHQQHRPRERRAHFHHLAMRGQQAHERPLGEVIDVP